MSAFLTVAEFERITGRTLTAAESDRVGVLLDAGSELARTLSGGQTIEYVTGDTVTVTGDGSAYLWLPQVPVTAVNTVTVDGTVIPTSEYRWNRLGMVEKVGSVWVRWGTSGWGTVDVTVNYDHGWETIPARLKWAVAEMVARQLDSPGSGVRSVALDPGYQVSYFDGQSTSMWPSAAEEAVFASLSAGPASA